ncbi:unnamed protein product [Colias eurytheme]|nr:unnamed protein product [Colias eurytheme]
MSQWTGAHRAFAVEAYFASNKSCTVARRKFCSQYKIRRLSEAPSESLIRTWIQKFRATGSTANEPRPGPSRTSRTAQNIERVASSVQENPRQSVRKRASSLRLPKTTLHRILSLDIKLHPFKIQLVQALKPNDYRVRKEFCENMLSRFRTVNTIWFSDEAHFHLNGFVNKQNCRYWAPRGQNPRLKHQQPLNSPKVTVWAALSVNGIIGPFFFENSRGVTVTVDGDVYRRMIREYFIPKLREHPSNSSHTWFQQDGATPHTARTTMSLLREEFPGKLISRFGDISWPPRSPDLTPLDFFLWGYLKGKVYESNPTNLSDLKENIVREMNAIPRSVLQRVAQNTLERIRECVRRDGKHLDGVIFKK